MLWSDKNFHQLFICLLVSALVTSTRIQQETDPKNHVWYSLSVKVVSVSKGCNGGGSELGLQLATGNGAWQLGTINNNPLP